MKLVVAASAIAVAVLASAAWAEPLPVPDGEYVKKASVGNTFEVEEAKVALDRATDQRLKDYAQKMIDDHGKAMKQLEEAAGKAHHKAEMTLDKPHQAMLDNLKTFTGTDFDKVYIADQVASHVETVDLLSDYKQSGKNHDLMAWTDDALPIVKGHLATINAM